MKKVKSIGVLSLGKILGLLYAIMGFLFGGIMSLITLVSLRFSSSEEGVGGGLLFGIAAIIIIPIIYGIMGFLGGILAAWLYNLVVRWVGGLEVEIVEAEEIKSEEVPEA